MSCHFRFHKLTEKGHQCGRAQPRTDPDGPSGQGEAGIARWAGEGTGCPEALATGRALDLQLWASGSDEGVRLPEGCGGIWVRKVTRGARRGLGEPRGWWSARQASAGSR